MKVTVQTSPPQKLFAAKHGVKNLITKTNQKFNSTAQIVF